MPAGTLSGADVPANQQYASATHEAHEARQWVQRNTRPYLGNGVLRPSTIRDSRRLEELAISPNSDSGKPQEQ
jgi:hypothetical protein